MAIQSARRYYLRKSHALDERLEWPLAAAYRAKQRQSTGEMLPVGFPHRAELEAADYTAREDLNGASVEELTDAVRLTRREAMTVLAALATLP